jgi:tRNA uridine 5-carbamoylmethylation protein Kti12
MGQWMSDRADDLEGFLFPQREFMILISGQPKSGKSTCSTLFKKFYKNVKSEPSEMDKHATIQRVVNDEIYLEVYDFQEQELWKEQTFDSLIFVLDSTSTMEDLEEAKKQLESMSKMEQFQSKKKGKETPFLILLNKKDLESKVSKEEIVQKFGLEDLKLKWHMEEVSMEKEEEDVKKGFQWMCDVLYPPLPGWLQKFAFFELESGIDEMPKTVDSDDEVEIKTEFIKN